MPSPATASFRSLVALIALLVPTTSAALTIKSATLTVHPVKGDSFAIKGEFGPLDPPGIDFGAAGAIVFDLDGVVAGFGAADLKRGKTRLSYKAPSKTPGLSQLVIDLKKRRFTAKGSGLLLPGLPATFTVRLRADADTACALLPFERLGKLPAKPPTKPKAVKYGLPKKHPGLPCLLEGRLRAHPPALEIGAPTSVRFTATLAPGIVPDPGGVQVKRFESGAAVEPPLCALVDDGGPASGDLVAGDGLYACTATIAAGALGTQRYVAHASVGGTLVGSAVLAVPVVPVLTEDAVAASFDAQTQARLLWDDLEAQLGNTVNARIAALRRIAALPGVADAQLGANGSDIVIRFTSGLRGGLLLSARFGDVVALRRSAEDGPVAPSASFDASGTGPRAADDCPVTPDRILIGNRKALILKTSYFGSYDDWPLAEAAFKASCLPLTPTVQTLTRATILNAFSTSPSAIFFSTHGFVDTDFSISIVTDETADKDDAILWQFADPSKRYDAEVIGLPKKVDPSGRNVWIVRPSLLRSAVGTIDEGFVYASHCHSIEDREESTLFRSKGALTYFGYDGTTSNTFARLVTPSLIGDLAKYMLTTGDAFDRTVHVDPDPQKHDPLGKGLKRTELPPATFHMVGERQLAYVDKPTVSPPASTIDQGASVVLTPSVGDKGACTFRHAWTNTVRAGELSDGTGNGGGAFETLEATVTYEADDDDSGIDALTCSVRADEDAPYFGTACASVEVRGCGDGKVSGTEECDGDADTACPGKCLSDCTCRKDPACGNGVKEAGEICDGNDREICDALSSPRDGYCQPDCHGCGQCGDGALDPNEECELTDDSPCPGACLGDCTCGCAPGDPNACPADACCHPQLKRCCTPRRLDADPECFGLTASGCCGDGGSLEPDFCQGPGGPSVCPDAECNDTTFYWCYVCDNKFMSGFCDFGTQSCTTQ